MTTPLTTDLLSAYIDGELDSEKMKAVESALETDRPARKKLARLTALNAMLSDAYDTALKGPVPLRTARPLRGTGAGGPAVERARLHRRYIGAVAASLAIALLAFPAGFMMSDRFHQVEMARLETQLEADRSAMAGAMSEALEKRLSGVAVRWQNSETGSAGSVTPIRTFQNSDGRWCREYREEKTLLGHIETHRAIACRSTAGAWKNRLLAVGDS
jgi:anti-sigma factor RsiW